MDIKLFLPSVADHCAQIVSGFMMLSEDPSLNINLKIDDKRYDESLPYRESYIVVADIDGKKVVYDVMDGYQSPKTIKYYMKSCEYYFKRSFNADENKLVFDENELNRVHPLGMNYLVMSKDNPYAKHAKSLKGILTDTKEKLNLGKPNSYFTHDKFEQEPEYKDGNFKILFSTMLWEPPTEAMRKIDPDYYQKDLEWVTNLNRNRINTIKALRESYGDLFIGGLVNTPLAKKLAPDLIVNKKRTSKLQYLQTVKDVDICVGTLGLHRSTGWKTGEYVAASKAIVHEPFVYENVGNFEEGVNYLAFNNDKELLSQIEYLINNPDKIYEMKKANHEYYMNYIRPDALIKNTIDIINK